MKIKMIVGIDEAVIKAALEDGDHGEANRALSFKRLKTGSIDLVRDPSLFVRISFIDNPRQVETFPLQSRISPFLEASAFERDSEGIITFLRCTRLTPTSGLCVSRS